MTDRIRLARLIRRQHAEFFLGLAEQAAPQLLGTAEEEWLECGGRETLARPVPFRGRKIDRSAETRHPAHD